MKTCLIPTCTDPVDKRGWCQKHYRRWLRHGDPMKTTAVARDIGLKERLQHHGWDEVPGPLSTHCWEWKSTRSGGYGMMRFEGSMKSAHRLSYIAFVGPIPEGKIIRHKCDNPPCINPEHLVPGTHKDNMHDRDSRNRRVPASGEKHGMAKLNWELVREIRAKYTGERGQQRALADEYGIGGTTVWNILNGKNWVEEDL